MCMCGRWVGMCGGRCVRRGGSHCSVCVCMGVVCQGEYFWKVM